MDHPQRIANAIFGLVLLTIGPACSQKDIGNSDLGGKTDTTFLHSLRRELEQIRNHFPGDMSIYMKNLSTAEEIALDPDTESFRSPIASLLRLRMRDCLRACFMHSNRD
jgi:hypothetical protein